ncbi:hypothetical protein BC829DRAFT_417816 [Chytridium lagenaria]|nr:hypothetical protein BC829DRAFT_417816 [Chytridium lagenaria]
MINIMDCLKTWTRLRVYPSDRRTEPLAAPLTGRRPKDARLGSRIYPTIAVWVPGTPPPCEGETASRRMRLSRIGAHANGEKVAYAGPDYCDRHRRLSPGASRMQDIRLFPSLLRWCEGKTIRSGWSVLTAVWCQEYLLSQVASRGLQ